MNISCLLENEAELPRYATEGAAGADVKAHIVEPIVIFPGQRLLIPTGLRVCIPDGFEMQVRPRSGLALKYGITVCNAPGTIDSDYRGEIRILLINLGNESFTIEPGMRIAQLVVAPVIQVSFIPQNQMSNEELAATVRGEGGFGHTGDK